MTVETDADRLAFLDDRDFGAVATWQGTQVKGLLDKPYQAAFEGTAPLEAARPVFTCRESDVSGVAHGQSLTVGGVSYTIRGVQPDGTGLILLVLEEA